MRRLLLSISLLLVVLLQPQVHAATAVTPLTNGVQTTDLNANGYNITNVLHLTLANGGNIAVQPSWLGQAGATVGQVLTWNGTAFAPAASGSGTAPFNIANLTANSVLVGNNTGVGTILGPVPSSLLGWTSGNLATNITIGSGLTLAGTTLTASGGGGNVTGNQTLNVNVPINGMYMTLPAMSSFIVPSLEGDETFTGNQTMNGTVNSVYGNLNINGAATTFGGASVIFSSYNTFYGTAAFSGPVLFGASVNFDIGINSTTLTANGSGNFTDYLPNANGTLLTTAFTGTTNITTLGPVTAGSFGSAVTGTNGTISGNDTAQLATFDSVLKYTVPITDNGGAYIFNGTVPGIIGIDPAGNTSYTAALTVNGGFYANSTLGEHDLVNSWQAGNTGYISIYGTQANVLGIWNQRYDTGTSGIRFIGYDNITTTTPMEMGAIGYVNSISRDDSNYNAARGDNGMPWGDSLFLQATPGLNVSNGTESSSTHELRLMMAGNFTYTNGTVINSNYASMVFANDWGLMWYSPDDEVKMYETSPQLHNQYGNLSSTYPGYGSNILAVVGTDAYKYANSPGTNGGAAGGFLAISNSTNAVGLVAQPSTMNYQDFPPGGWSLTGGGNGMVEADGGNISIYLTGIQSGNKTATFSTTGLLLGPVSTQNLTVNGTANISSWVEFGGNMTLGAGTNTTIANTTLNTVGNFVLGNLTGCFSDDYLPQAYVVGNWIRDNVNNENALYVQNLNNGGYSAVSFINDAGNETMAVGHGNSGSAAFWAGYDFIEVDGFGGVAGKFEINQTTINTDGTWKSTNQAYVLDSNATSNFISQGSGQNTATFKNSSTAGFSAAQFQATNGTEELDMGVGGSGTSGLFPNQPYIYTPSGTSFMAFIGANTTLPALTLNSSTQATFGGNIVVPGTANITGNISTPALTLTAHELFATGNWTNGGNVDTLAASQYPLQIANSTWAGEGNIVTVGTVTTGTMNATIGNATLLNGSVITGNAEFQATPAANLAAFNFSANPNITVQAIPPLGVPYVAAFIDGDTAYGGIANFAYGHSGGTFSGYRSEGTGASPTATGADHTEAGVYGGGFDGTNWAVGSYINFESYENWNTSSHGTGFYWSTTPVGTLTTQEPMGGVTDGGDMFITPYAYPLNTSPNPYNIFRIQAAVNQNGGRQYSGILENITETSVGSGPNLFLDMQISGNRVFSVSDTGNTVIGGNASSFGNSMLSVNGTANITGAATFGSTIIPMGNIAAPASLNLTSAGSSPINIVAAGNITANAVAGNVTIETGFGGTVLLDGSDGQILYGNTTFADAGFGIFLLGNPHATGNWTFAGSTSFAGAVTTTAPNITVNGQAIAVSANIDSTAVANTTLYTPNAGKNFVVTSISVENLVDNTVSVPAQMVVSAGATTNNVTTTLTDTTPAAGQYYPMTLATQPFMCTNAAPVTLRVTVGATATTATIKVVLTGIEN